MAAKISLPISDDKRQVRPPRVRRLRPIILLAMGLIVLYTVHSILWPPMRVESWRPVSKPADAVASEAAASSSNSPAKSPAVSTNKLVPLEAHIMTKCPDARDCFKQLVLPAMVKVSDKVNFTLSFIGVPTENDGVDCKHGPQECMGNIIELCAAVQYPDPKIYLGFTMCLLKSYHDIPQQALVEDCALEHGMDFKLLNECATMDDGGFGVGLLRNSVTRTSDAGVTKSCTVRLNEEIYCIMDNGEWKDCPSGPGVNDLVIAVEKLYRSSASA